ncbi:16S rRNA (guanine(527)-N(7))-methyltransferase RsmG [Herbiconiux ginsengi]|uniref:Ribosomal RNA small subunit methyltransferase G n=1 Tax=Herbiconiux ginsengi TaxID=381665 RepID=A0A1H3M8D4_9MICO|nr:16S rRNA (guanine(527)-N(7))-methyltransferase RsmG [Herbiconiux ginsengi]SDY72275.1 16S rRNA m(7)G-527 methyltransferase [Herbiconiux ginsengi]
MTDDEQNVVETEPAAAAVVFGDRIDLARLYTADLVRRGEELGLIGPLELPRIWSRHIINSGVVAPLLRPGLVGDIGSGAGLPGVVLAIARPDVDFVLVEPMERRVAWLEEQRTLLGLTNVTVVRARAEEARLPQRLDQVTARAVSAFSKLIPMTAPLLRPGGEMVLMKGAGASAEIAAAEKAIRKYKLADVEVLELGESIGVEVTRVIRARVPA